MIAEPDTNINAELLCGAGINIVQGSAGQILEITVFPKKGTRIEDTAWVQNGVLRINVTQEAATGIFQLLGMVLFPQPKKIKRWVPVAIGVAIAAAAILVKFLK